MDETNMKEERIKILDMIEKGLIKSDEGVRLINAIQNNGSSMEEKLNKITKNFESLSKDITQKAKDLAKDLEPKIKSCNNTMGKMAIEALDGLSKAVEHTFKTDEQEEQKEEDTTN